MKTIYNVKTGLPSTLSGVDANEQLACGMATAEPNAATRKNAIPVAQAAPAPAVARTTAGKPLDPPAATPAAQAAAPAPDATDAPVDCFKSMTAPLIKAELTERGVGFADKALKRDLADLLNDARSVQKAD